VPENRYGEENTCSECHHADDASKHKRVVEGHPVARTEAREAESRVSQQQYKKVLLRIYTLLYFVQPHGSKEIGRLFVPMHGERHLTDGSRQMIQARVTLDILTFSWLTPVSPGFDNGEYWGKNRDSSTHWK
jgi:hypothetical protein